MTENADGLWRPLVSVVRSFLRFAGWRGPPAALLMIAGGALEGMSLALVVPLVALLSGHHAAGHSIVAGWFDRIGVMAPNAQLMVALCAFVFATTLRAVILVARDRLLMSLQVAFTDKQRTDLVTALAASRWQDITGLRHARILHALGSEIPRAATALHLLLAIAASAAMLFAQWVLILFLSPGLALPALLVMVPAALITRPLLRQAGALGHALTGGNLQMLDATQQFLGGLKPALAQNLEAPFLAEFRSTLAALAGRQKDYVRRQGYGRILATALAAIALAAAILLVRRLALPMAVTVGILAVFQRMFGPAMTILRSAQQLAGMLPSTVAIDQLRSELQKSMRTDEGGPVEVGHVSIRFDRVSFSYRQDGGEIAGITDVSLRIEPGELVGVAGASGAGKTSFVDLLAGLVQPDSGTILLDETPLDPRDYRRIRARLSYATQDGWLVHDTVRRNLTWGLEAVDEEHVWRTLEIVEAAAFVRGLDGGLDSVVGERACRLSGGERQRLGLARALLRSPSLLILDEATNALDIETESRVLQRLVGLDHRRTIVLVSHRPETLRICPRILTFDRGMLVNDHRPAVPVSA